MFSPFHALYFYFNCYLYLLKESMESQAKCQTTKKRRASDFLQTFSSLHSFVARFGKEIEEKKKKSIYQTTKIHIYSCKGKLYFSKNGQLLFVEEAKERQAKCQTTKGRASGFLTFLLCILLSPDLVRRR